jgi:hypothetical protein
MLVLHLDLSVRALRLHGRFRYPFAFTHSPMTCRRVREPFLLAGRKASGSTIFYVLERLDARITHKSLRARVSPYCESQTLISHEHYICILSPSWKAFPLFFNRFDISSGNVNYAIPITINTFLGTGVRYVPFSICGPVKRSACVISKKPVQKSSKSGKK